MKNLRVQVQSQRDIDKLNTNNDTRVLSCLNSDNDHLYVCLNNVLYDIPPDVNIDYYSLDLSEYTNSEIVALEYSSLLESVICALDSGVILTVDINKQAVTSCNLFCDNGIKTIKLSPDHELLVVVDKQNSMHLLFTHPYLIEEVDEYLPINVEYLDNEEFGEQQFINVGWGKKETQFHGSEGKAAAKIVKTAIKTASYDSGSTTISWRADGSLFAISYKNQLNSLRMFKVFNREGVLQSTSEQVDGLNENLSWKPSGNLIATTQELPNKQVVAFFEKNGLKHRDFAILLKEPVMIKHITWSSDSEVLSILYENEKGDCNVELWTEKNYHWYLKQNLNFGQNDSVTAMHWSSVSKSGKKLFILTRRGLKIYTYNWTIDHSRGKDLIDNSVVGVIDGEKVLLTSFTKCVVPPPMSQFELKLETQINAIVFAPPKGRVYDSNAFFCVLDNFCLAFCKYTDDQYIHDKKCIIKWKYTEENYLPYSLYNFYWLNDDTIVCAVSEENYLLVMKIDFEKQIILVENKIFIPGSIEHIIQSIENPDDAYIFTSDNEVMKFNVIENDQPINYLYMNESFEQIDIININEKDMLICRTNRHRFYINDRNVLDNVTSFYIHSKFLLLTTLQHTLLCFPLTQQGLDQLMTSDLTIKPWENENAATTQYLNLRRIERGGTLVISVANDARTVLQMPRGNLECIQPRTLSLFTIAQRLDQLKYYEAFDLMRKQRINLNLLYDHNPELFLNNVDKFINSIMEVNPSWLSLFLSELKNEDVTLTTYASCYLDRVEKTKTLTGKENDKVKQVCNIMKETMEKSGQKEKLLQPILISLVKGNESVEDALRKVKLIQTNNGLVAEALKFLLYLVDVNDLFDSALGMYDLDLTMLVAQKSQKDPKEYVPFLNNFRNMQEDCMKFEIDKYLKRFESALSNLAKMPDRFDECIEFVKNHDLYASGMKLFTGDSMQYKRIAIAYAESLLQNAKYEEAGIMFAKGADFESSMNAYRLAGNWQECVVMAHRANLSDADIKNVYKTLISRLKSEKKFKEAAIIASKYMGNVKESIQILSEGKLWIDAWREAVSVQHDDMFEPQIRLGVVEYAQNLTLQIQNNRKEFEKHKERLKIVQSLEYQKAKQAQFNTAYECDITTADGIDDMISDTASHFGSNTSYSSQMSRSTGRSYRSSKNKRKQQRKLLNLKEGSLFEDLALFRALHQIITSTYSQKAEVHDVINMLLLFNEDSLGQELYKELDEFLYLIEVSESKIWSFNNQTEENGLQKTQFLCGTIPQGLIEPHILYPPKKETSSWTMSIFKRTKKI